MNWPQATYIELHRCRDKIERDVAKLAARCSTIAGLRECASGYVSKIGEGLPDKNLELVVKRIAFLKFRAAEASCQQQQDQQR